MSKLVNAVARFFSRFRYPAILPEEITQALGTGRKPLHSFEDFLRSLTCPSCRATKLTRFMPREKAEEVFAKATCAERFRQNSLFSYYFNEGWMEFVLIFDDQSRLRRLYLQHKMLKEEWEIKLAVAE